MHSCKELNSFLSEVRRMETLEQRVNGHDQANRALLEQIMKLTQDMKVRISVTYLIWILPLARILMLKILVVFTNQTYLMI